MFGTTSSTLRKHTAETRVMQVSRDQMRDPRDSLDKLMQHMWGRGLAKREDTDRCQPARDLLLTAICCIEGDEGLSSFAQNGSILEIRDGQCFFLHLVKPKASLYRTDSAGCWVGALEYCFYRRVMQVPPNSSGRVGLAADPAHGSLMLHMLIKAACSVLKISHSMLVWMRRRDRGTGSPFRYKETGDSSQIFICNPLTPPWSVCTHGPRKEPWPCVHVVIGTKVRLRLSF